MRLLVFIVPLSAGCAFIWGPPDLDGVDGDPPLEGGPALDAELTALVDGVALQVTFHDPNDALSGGRLRAVGSGFDIDQPLPDGSLHRMTSDVELFFDEPPCGGADVQLDVWAVGAEVETDTVETSLSIWSHQEGIRPSENVVDDIQLPMLWCGWVLGGFDRDELTLGLEPEQVPDALLLDWAGDDLSAVEMEVDCVDPPAAVGSSAAGRPLEVQAGDSECRRLEMELSFVGAGFPGRDYWLLIR